MPVVQLQNDTGANLGSALGAAAGYFATQKQRKADKATAVADKQHTTDREDAAAADTHADIQSKIKQRDTQDTALTNNTQNAQNALGAYNTYFPMLSTGTTGPDGKKLTGPALGKALQNIRIEAMNKGAFSDEKTAQQRQTDFNTEIARILQEDKAASTQSFLGKEAKTAIPGDPQQMLNFLLKHRLPAERAAGIDTKDTMAMITDAQRQVNEANLERQRGTQNQNAAQRIQIQLDRPPAEHMPRNADGLTPYEELENRRWTQTHNPDGSPKAPGRGDMSGLSNEGKQKLAHDMTAWTLGGMDPASQPDPSDPKYAKRVAAGGGGGTAPGGGKAVTRTGRSASAPGKPTLYEMSDGSWKP
jgi:hypothetical protein